MPLKSAKRDEMFYSIFKYAHYLIVDEVSMMGNTNITKYIADSIKFTLNQKAKTSSVAIKHPLNGNNWE